MIINFTGVKNVSYISYCQYNHNYSLLTFIKHALVLRQNHDYSVASFVQWSFPQDERVGKNLLRSPCLTPSLYPAASVRFSFSLWRSQFGLLLLISCGFHFSLRNNQAIVLKSLFGTFSVRKRSSPFIPGRRKKYISSCCIFIHHIIFIFVSI